MKTILNLFLILTLCSPIFAQTPVITPNITGQTISLTPTLPANTGVLWRLKQGPTGTWYITLATAQNNQPGIYDYIVTITPASAPDPTPTPPTPTPNPLVISTDTLPNTGVGNAYKQSIVSNGGTAPYSYSISSAKLPTGLTLSLAGEISGTPTEAGTYNFVIQVKDSKGQVASKQYTVVVVGATPVPVPIPTPAPIYTMIVYDPDKLDNVPLAQSSIFTSKVIRDYLDSKSVKDKNGKPQWKFLSWNADPAVVKDIGPNFKAWYDEVAPKAKAANKFWLVVTNGKDTYNDALPANIDKALETLKKYGG